ncbi:MAG: DNA polymerase IV [Roseibacillus sp.]|nr:DNA polymerase IV [Roseibacillus sp.]
MRKILHIDMDCFYAAIEVRDDPSLQGKPVAVGGVERGVLTTASYEARRFGCHSAMPTFKALQLCPDLIVRPTRFDVYAAESQKVRRIFRRFTELVEPLSLDEAYLDVTHHQEEGALVASKIRSQIEEETGLTASGGIAPNKLLAKIASEWKKPNGQFEIRPGEIEEFLEHLPVKRLHGVGRKMEEKLAAIEVLTCGDLQRISKLELADRFGNWGVELYELCRGRDERPVKTNRIRKSVSSETTLRENIGEFSGLVGIMEELRGQVMASVSSKHASRVIKALVVKLKFSDFSRTTAERAPGPFEPGRNIDEVMDAEDYRALLAEAWERGNGKAVRLVGLGVRFADPESKAQLQLEL